MKPFFNIKLTIVGQDLRSAAAVPTPGNMYA